MATPPTDERRSRVATRGWLLPAAVLLVGWALSAWMFVLLQNDTKRRQEEYFSERVAEAQAAIRVRMTAYEDALRGGIAYYAASQSVDRDEWRLYAESLQLRNRYPGINGLGVILAVPPDRIEQWRARVRVAGEPEPQIQAFPGTTDAPGIPRYLITYLEGNIAGTALPIGRNIATEPSRREAAEEARDSGELRIHHRVAGSRDTQRRSGLLVYVPLYVTGAKVTTVAERRAAHLGWIYAQVYPDLFLDGVLGPMGETLRVHFFEAGGLNAERLLYASAGTGTEVLPRFDRLSEMVMAGERFQLGWRRGPKFPPAETSPAIWTAASGALATLLLAGLVMSLQSVGARANAIAAARTAELAANAAELRKSQEMFQRLFESSPDAVILAGADGRIVRTNARADMLFGWPAGALVGQFVNELIPPRLRAQHEADLARYFEHPMAQPITGQIELFGLRYDRTEFPIDLLLSPVESSDGVQTLAVVRDITERKRLEETLANARDAALEASRLKSEFLANISHEIRTPMNAVVGMTGLLADTPLTSEQQEMVQTIQGGADSLVTIISDVLDFSKIEAGKMRLDAAGFDFRQVIEETTGLLAPRAREKGLHLGCEVDATLPPQVLGDAGRVRQVFTNLLGNALKFTDRGEVAVTVRVVRTAGDQITVRTSVRDTGVGISLPAQRRLFQPFTQEDNSATRRFGGTGLGLAISKQLVELMGGGIGFESESGRGSNFWFEVSFIRLAAATPPEVVPTGKRVLVVDDNETNRRITLGQLARLGVNAESVADAPTALARLRDPAAGPWHAALIDWQIPGMSGMDLAMELRAGAGTDALPVVMLSSVGAQLDPALIAAGGVAAFLTKPVSDLQLQRCLARVLGAVPTASRPPIPVGPRRRILLVEDNPANQRVATLLLAKLGHQVDVAVNGQQGLERLAAGRYDVVLMDCQMPVLDGYEATRRIRRGEVKGVDPRIPIVALTAYAMAGDRAKCLEAGMNEHLGKPIRAAELSAALARVGAPAAVTVAPTAGDAPVFDSAALAMVRALPGSNGRSLLPEMISTYLANEPAQLQRLTALAGAYDGALGDAAHHFAGGAGAFGAVAMRAQLLELEAISRRGDWPAVTVQLERVRAEATRLREAIAQENLLAG